MNIMLAIVLILAVLKMIDGYRHGMIKEIVSLVSLVFLCFVVALIGNGISSYFDKKYINVIIVVVVLALLALVHRLLELAFFSAKLLAKLPIVNWLDKVLGLFFGVLEVVLFLWTLYTFVMLMDLGVVAEQIIAYTSESSALSWLYEHNYLADFIQFIVPGITFL